MARRSSTLRAIFRVTRSRSTMGGWVPDGPGDEPPLEVEVLPVVLVAPEGVELEALQSRGVAVEQAAALRDLLEEQRIGAVEDRQVDLPVREQALQLVEKPRALCQCRRGPLEQHGKIHVARRVELSRD